MDKLLTTCGMPSAPLKQRPSRQKGSDWMQESRECTELKITSKRSSSWFSKETGIWLSIWDVTSCPSTNPAVIKHVNRHGNSKKNKKKEPKLKKNGDYAWQTSEMCQQGSGNRLLPADPQPRK